MGGKVAQALVARRPAGLAGVVLVAPAPAAPAGSLEQLQQLTMHAYDDEQSVHLSIHPEWVSPIDRAVIST
jgi:pimeloyl-ACP methyl ester carboxylesterase